jgi:hypothetical protein
MANIFDQFDEEKKTANVFDQFDTPTITRGLPPAPAGTEEIPTMVPRQRAVAAQAVGAQRQAQREAEAASKIPIKTAVETPELFQRAKAYMAASGQKPQQPDESNEDFFNRFMSQRRFAETSVLFGGVPELNRLVNATAEEKKAIAEGRDLFQKLEEQKGFGPIVDYGKGVAADLPLYVVSGGVGSVATKEGIRIGTKELLKREASEQALKQGSRVGIAGAEAVTGGMTDITAQRIGQETARVFGEEVPEIDKTRTGAVALFSAALGYGLPVVAEAANIAQTRKQGEALAEAIAARGPVVPASPTAPPTRVEKALVDPVTQQMDKVHEEFMKNYGRSLLDTIDPVNELTDAKVRTEFSKTAVRVALKVMQEDPTFALKPNQQISTAINNVFKNLDKVDNVALEKALTDAGVTQAEFAAMNKASVSEGARLMQPYSVAARLLNSFQKADPVFDKKIKDLYAFDNEAVGAFSKFNEAQQRLAREWKAIITSGVDTTARNTLSVALVMPLKSGVQFMEGTAYSIGKAVKNVSDGKGIETFKKSMADTIKDSFDVYFYMADPRRRGLAADASDAILKHNPTIRNNINSALQETGNKEVMAITRWANSFNVAIDSFVRRAVFTDSVDRQLRRQGKDLYKDFLSKDISIPTPIITQATKESLQTTFAYMPKKGDATISSSVERGASTIASEVISAIDKTPLINFAIPFPRYMSNAMAYLYRYSPVGSIGAGQDFVAASKLAAAGKTEQAQMLQRQGTEKMIQAGIGMGTLAAAYEYRKENIETPWYEVKTTQGTTVDLRPLGVPATYFALAEVQARREQGTLEGRDIKDALESVTGMKFKAGSGDTFIDRILRSFDSEFEGKKLMVEVGKFTGDIAGGFTQPYIIKQLFDVVNTLREEGTVVRDPNVLESEDAFLAGLEAATQRVMGRLPIAKEQLPESVIRLTEQEVKREGEYFNRLVGFRQTIKRNPVETEIVRLNLDPFKLYGASSGVPEYDRAFIKAANERVLSRTPVIMNSNEYKVLPDDEKNLRLTNAVRDAVSQAREKVKEEFKLNDLKTVYRLRYNKLPRSMRGIINRRYAEDNEGVSFEEAATADPNKWFDLDKYENELKARVGDTKEQSQQLFRR